MTCEVDELSVEHTFGRSPDDDTFKVIVPILSGCTLDLLIGFNIAVQEEFHRRAEIKSDKEVSGPGENENKAIDGIEGESCPRLIFPVMIREMVFVHIRSSLAICRIVRCSTS